MLAKTTKGIPFLGAAINAISVGVYGLLALENSPILKKVEEAINHVSAYAKKLEREIKEGRFALLISKEEYEEALRAKESFADIEEKLSEEQREELEVAQAVNELGLALADVDAAMNAQPESFEHYLRLRATQKLLNIQRKKVVGEGGFSGLSKDDWFLIRVAADLVKKDPELSQAAALRIDGILRERFGKSLQSFVYEEIIANWELKAKLMAKDVDDIVANISKMKVERRSLENAKKIQGELDVDEQTKLDQLNASLPEVELALEKAREEKEDIEIFANAAEGFLQALEKEEDELIAMGREYVLIKGEEVGNIIIKAADAGIHFSDLPVDEQETVRYFSQIFREDAEKRMAELLEVEAG
ncbi:hypothetical protein CO613_06755 [Lysobacteraceae bacterium NML07-0707]|nr:hypothetical protein CO613_06755 [Xanthomonadaceae bacterium NML07-0707]